MADSITDSSNPKELLSRASRTIYGAFAFHMEPTLCQGIILSDGVIREHGTGKLSIIGSFSTYNFPMFPFVAPPFIVTTLVTNLEGRLERFPITVRIEAPRTGHILASSVAEITTDSPIPRTEIFEVPVAIAPINYPEGGIYKVKVLAQNEPIGERDLTVRSLAAV
jgi:uncharacterized protein DUF6941